MNRALAFPILAFFPAVALPQQTKELEKPVESEHRHGPNGWDGWTLNYTIPDHPGERFPMTLVLAQNGRIVRRIEDGPFIWRWMFVAEGHRVAYETGPLHFSATCVLIDTKTGKRLDDYDCWQELPSDAPDWVKQLEASK